MTVSGLRAVYDRPPQVQGAGFSGIPSRLLVKVCGANQSTSVEIFHQVWAVGRSSLSAPKTAAQSPGSEKARKRQTQTA
jgi:hypothetical protein